MSKEIEQKVKALLNEACICFQAAFTEILTLREAEIDSACENINSRNDRLGRREAELKVEQIRLSERERLLADREATLGAVQELAVIRLEANKMLAKELDDMENKLKATEEELAELKAKFEGKQP